MTTLDAPSRPSRLDLARDTRSQAALTRLARRTARGGGWRHVLVIGLIALSVAAATGVAIGARSSQPTAAQQLAWRFGAADLRVESHDTGHLAFGDLPAQLRRFVRDAGLPRRTVVPVPDPGDLIAQVAPDADMAIFAATWQRTGTGSGLRLIAADPTEPLLEPMWDVAGPAPGPGEVLLSPAALQEFDTEVGQAVDLPIVGRVRVVGEAVIPNSVHSAAAIVHSETDLGARAGRIAVADVEGDPAPVATTLTEAARQLPVSVAARPTETSTAFDYPHRRVTEEPTFIGTVLGAVLLLQVAFVAAAAFATGIRRRLRELGLLGAIGADPSQVRGLVLREALVLGVLGGALGAGLGVLAAWIGRPVTQMVANHLVDRFVVHPLDLIAPAALGALAALTAAFLPARTAGRVPVVTALAGRLPVRSVPRWITPVALAATVGGLALVGTTIRRVTGYGIEREMAVAAGTVATVLGAAALAVPLLGFVGRFADRLPAQWRLMVRDTIRQRPRSGAAVAALTVVLIVPVVIATTATTDAGRWQSREEARGDIVVVTGPWYEGVALPPTDAMVAQAQEALPAVDSRLEFPYYGVPGTYTQATLHTPTATRGAVAVRVHDQIGVATPAARAALGIDRTLARDEIAIASSPGSGADTPDEGRAELHIETFGPDRTGTNETVTLRAVDIVRAESGEVPHGIPHLLVSPDLADQLGLVPVGGSVLLDLERDLTEDELRTIQRLGENEPVHFRVNASGNARSVDPDPMIALALGIALAVALVISGMTAALAATESDRDLELMTVVGAEPRLRRGFHGRQAGYHALVAALLAIPTGLLLARVITISTSPGLGVVIPWSWLLAVLVAVPLLTGLAHRVLMRSATVRPPRRIT